MTNVAQLWNSEGVPNFKYLVEGGECSRRLSCGTDWPVSEPFRDAERSSRAREEGRRAVRRSPSIRQGRRLTGHRFRDSSANKGGVTSSSLEVLVGMSLTDDEFLELMTSPNDEGAFSPSGWNYSDLGQVSRTSTWRT